MSKKWYVVQAYSGFEKNVQILKQRNWICDVQPLHEALGFEPSYDLRKGLEEVIQADFTPSKRSNRNPSETKQKT